jgi:hypothetical protein
VKRLIPVLLLLVACGKGATTSAPSPTPSPTPLPSPSATADPRDPVCLHYRAHINNLFNIIANPTTETDFGIQQINDQINEFKKDVKKTDDADAVDVAKEFIQVLQKVVNETPSAGGVQAAFAQNIDAWGTANEDGIRVCA